MSTGPRSVLVDVVRLWAHAPAGAADAHAEALDLPQGWVRALGRAPERPRTSLHLPSAEPAGGPLPVPDPATLPTSQSGRVPLRAPTLVVVAADFTPKGELASQGLVEAQRPALTPEDYGPWQVGPEPRVPLAPKSRWWPALRGFSPRKACGIDLPRVVALLARARAPSHLPLRTRRGQFRELCVLRDTRKAMVPFAADFDELEAYLLAQPQAARLTVLRCAGLPRTIPASADAVLVLSDLGWSEASSGDWPQRQWQAWAQRLRQRGVAVQAWVPVSAQAIPDALARELDCVPWHGQSRFKPLRRGQAGPQTMDKAARAAQQIKAQVWPWLACAQRVEPALLRRARLALGGAGQPQWESLLWRDDDDLAAGEVALQTRPSAVPGWRQAFGLLSAQAQLQVWRMLHDQHAHWPRSTLVLERLVWHSHACTEARQQVQTEVAQAAEWLQCMAAQEAQNSREHAQAAQRNEAHGLHTGFIQSMVQRNAGDAAFTASQPESYARLAVAAGLTGQGEGVSPQTWLIALPKGPEDSGLPWRWVWLPALGSPLLVTVYRSTLTSQQTYSVRARTVLEPGQRSTCLWQPLGASARPLVNPVKAEPGTLSFKDALGVHSLTLAHFERPAWATAMGSDRYGVVAEWVTSNIFMRLRYLPPATFLMGSPDGVGHGDEHPQHPVTLTQALWLAETPCTQALWQAVMGQNPSHFKKGPEAPQRPVENVSWDDVQQFLAKLNKLLPDGCEAVLPTEAQWEYACRAGTATAYWWGDEPDDSKANFDSRGDKKWDDEEGTTPVDRYLPNPWGLRDMHGNVDEWCADGLRTYEQGTARDPMGDTGGDARVLRGGSWVDHPGGARSAFRSGRHQGFRVHFLGFRFALRSSSPQGAEPQPGGLKADQTAKEGGEVGGRSAGTGASGKAIRATPNKKGVA